MFIFANNMQQSLSGLRALILTEAVLVPSGPRCGVRAAGARPGTARARASAVPTHGARPGETGETETPL